MRAGREAQRAGRSQQLVPEAGGQQRCDRHLEPLATDRPEKGAGDRKRVERPDRPRPHKHAYAEPASCL